MTFDPLSVAAGVGIGVPAHILWLRYRHRSVGRGVRRRVSRQLASVTPLPARRGWHPSEGDDTA